ncbi:hypothetical protein C356_04150 [Cryptococcus neoformans c45]|nr:hypothetical protein C356_04150 [Cryptococcus neoformans var. grubii c45]
MDRNRSSSTSRKRSRQTPSSASIVYASTSSKQRSQKTEERGESGDVRNYDSSDMTDGSEFESPVEDEEDNDQIFYIDAIMYAHFRDTRARKDGPGWFGWHYGVMWKGYLKSSSDTEEPLSSFETELNIAPLVTSFWQAVDKPIPKGKLEPPGRKGDYYEIPPDQMEEILLTCYPKRTWKIYSRRRAKQRAHQLAPPKIRAKPLRIQKRDSDHYNYERYKRRRKAMQEAEEKQKKAPGIKEKEEKGSQEWASTSASDSDSIEMSLDDENNVTSTSDKRPQEKRRKGPKKTRKHVLGSSSEEENQIELKETTIERKRQRISSFALSSVPSRSDSSRSSKHKECSMQPSVEVEIPIAVDRMRSKQPSQGTDPAQLSFGQLQPGIFGPDPPVPALSPGGLRDTSRTVAATVVSSITATESFTATQKSGSQPLPSVLSSQAPHVSTRTQTQSSRQLSPQTQSQSQPQAQSQLQAQSLRQTQLQPEIPNSLSAASVSGLPAAPNKTQLKSTSLSANQNQETIADVNNSSKTPLASVLPQHNNRQGSKDNAGNTASPSTDSTAPIVQQQKQTTAASVEPTLGGPANRVSKGNIGEASRSSTTLSNRHILIHNQSSNVSRQISVSSLQEPIDFTSSSPLDIASDLPSSPVIPTGAGQNAPTHPTNIATTMRKKYEQPKRIKTIDDVDTAAQAIDIRAIRNSRKEQEHDGDAPHLSPQAPGPQRPKEFTKAQRRKLDEENLTGATRLLTAMLHRQSPQDIDSSQSRQSSTDPRNRTNSGERRIVSVSTNARSTSPAVARKSLDSRSSGAYHRVGASRTNERFSPQQSPKRPMGGENSGSGKKVPRRSLQDEDGFNAASSSVAPPEIATAVTTVPAQDNASTRVLPGATHDSSTVVDPTPAPTINVQEDNEESLFTPRPDHEDSVFTRPFERTDEVPERTFVSLPADADQASIQQTSQTSLGLHLGSSMPEDDSIVQLAQESRLEKERLEMERLQKQGEEEKRKGQQEKDRIYATEKMTKMREIQKAKADKEETEREKIAKKRAEEEKAEREKAAFPQTQPTQKLPMASRISQSYQPRRPAPEAQRLAQVTAPAPIQPLASPAIQTSDHPLAQPSDSTLIPSLASPAVRQMTSGPDERANNEATRQAANGAAQSPADQSQPRSITPVVQAASRPACQRPTQPKSQLSVQSSTQKPTQAPCQSSTKATPLPTPHQIIEPSPTVALQPTATYPSTPPQAVHAPLKRINHDIIYNLDTLLRLRQIRQDSPTEVFNSLPTPTSATLEQHRPFPTLCPVKSQGGIITFAPSLILEEPKLFEKVMEALKKTPNWGAYLAPPVITYFDQSWGDEDLCPDAMESFAILIAYLTLDGGFGQLFLADAPQPNGNGLTVSCNPPASYDYEACLAWFQWLQQVTKVSSFKDLADLCRLVKPGYFERKDQSIWTQTTLSATIQDAEGVIIDQLIDLSRMRTRDDLVEYDRFVYVGRLELSASAEARRKKYGAGIDFLTPEEFMRIAEDNASKA